MGEKILKEILEKRISGSIDYDRNITYISMDSIILGYHISEVIAKKYEKFSHTPAWLIEKIIWSEAPYLVEKKKTRQEEIWVITRFTHNIKKQQINFRSVVIPANVAEIFSELYEKLQKISEHAGKEAAQKYWEGLLEHEGGYEKFLLKIFNLKKIRKLDEYINIEL